MKVISKRVFPWSIFFLIWCFCMNGMQMPVRGEAIGEMPEAIIAEDRQEADPKREEPTADIILEEEILSPEERPESETDSTSEKTGSEETRKEIQKETQEDFLLEIEKVEEPELESEFQEKEWEGEKEEEELSPSGDAAERGENQASFYGARRARNQVLFAACYGEQLTGEAGRLYEEMKVWRSGKTSSILYEFEDPLIFEVAPEEIGDDGTIITSRCQDFQELKAALLGEVQAAFDAYAYDYPEVFWLKTIGYSYTPRYTKDSSGAVTGRITAIRLSGKERYTGAAAEMPEFLKQVTAVYQELDSQLQGENEDTAILRVIHDYLCNTLTYGQSSADTTGGFAHTAAGVFLKDKMVVCEGYAKAFKILADRFGIPTVLIIGDACLSSGKTEAHMWNYVFLEGNWYLIDTTWDDQITRISDTYFLAGAQTQGFNKVISEERMLYSRFSNSVYARSFVTPVLSQEAYQEEEETHEYGPWVIEKEPGCTETGIKSSVCKKCGAKRTQSILAAGHSFGAWKVSKEAACTEKGIKYRECEVCGEIQQWNIAELGHDYGDWEITREASCTEEGEKIRTCSRYGETEKVSIPKTEHEWQTVTQEATCEKAGWQKECCRNCSAVKEGSLTEIKASGHSFGEWKVVCAATCAKEGQSVRYCSKCNAKEKRTDAKTEHQWKTNKKNPTCTEPGWTEEYCSFCYQTKGKKEIKALGHRFGSWKKYKSATVFAKQVDKRVCARCGKTEKRESGSVLKPTIKVSISHLQLQTGQKTKQLKVSGLQKGDYAAKWKTSSSSIVKVSGSKDGNCIVQAQKKSGTAYLTITLASGLSKRVKVTVKKPVTEAIKGIPAKLTLKKGKTYSLKPKLVPANSQSGLQFRSSNSKIASVSKKGNITAKKKGKVKITVLSGKKKKECVVTVK